MRVRIWKTEELFADAAAMPKVRFDLPDQAIEFGPATRSMAVVGRPQLLGVGGAIGDPRSKIRWTNREERSSGAQLLQQAISKDDQQIAKPPSHWLHRWIDRFFHSGPRWTAFAR